MSIHRFTDLLGEAHRQPEPQRLLFVMTRAELPDHPSEAQRADFAAGEGGVLTPVLCVDKRPDELEDMAALAAEARETGMDWDIAFVAALSDPDGRAEVEAPLQRMVESVKRGEIDRFLAFDRQGEVVSFR
ncbi:ribonucleotide reductase subunit alpha [Halomonas koreensis]|uniref:Ribonucleotide reductase subunit alpha n=1 Tax=Halomonas koreensis TaxID=245385 RepID=A0ABU1G1S2_9GAMM|nr:ribonucleotide reductase subunit alpha [Halomonas koreensis]MDR5866865.1 ribonucleotide reductase subunit alpha [Halomonas koreensis]